MNLDLREEASVSDPNWDRLMTAVKVLAAAIPLFGTLAVVYSQLEVVKEQNVHTNQQIQLVRDELGEVKIDIRELRAEMNVVRNGHKP